jgi:hypothetical protein
MSTKERACPDQDRGRLSRASGNNKFLILELRSLLSEGGGDAFFGKQKVEGGISGVLISFDRYPSSFLLSIAARILSGVMGKSVRVTPMALAMAEA